MPTISNIITGNGNNAGTLTISNVVVNAGEQLIVAAMGSDGVGSGTRGEVTGVTYGGVSLTKVVEDTLGLADDGIYSSFWQLANPAAGTANVVITYNGTPAHGIGGAAITIVGGKTTIDASAHNGNGSTSSAPTTNTITTVADQALVMDIFVAASSTETITVGGAPQVTDYSIPNGGSVSPFTGSHYTKTPPGSASFSETPSNTARGYTWCAISIAPTIDNAKNLNNYNFVKVGNGMSTSAERRT